MAMMSVVLWLLLNLVTDFLDWLLEVWNLNGILNWLVSKKLLVLLLSPVSHGVKAKGGSVSVVLLVVLANELLASGEDSKSELVLLLGDVRLSVLGSVSLEFSLDGVIDL
jgi:hypothetical protein